MQRPTLRTASLFALALVLHAAAPAQTNKSLTIGDPAPPLKVEAWIKGTPFQLVKGKVYVIEFWATWCGPCIQSMPNLSELADRMKGKAEIISVNVLDRSPAGESTSDSKVHVSRITKWVSENAAKMRYNVVLDDAKDTMMKTWMSAAGQGGIPCAFVVDQEGTIAWIGHPEMGLSKVVELVHARKFDKKNAQKLYGISMRAPRAAEAEKEALKKLARTGDLKAIEKAYMARVKATGHPDIGAASLLAYELSKYHRSTALAFVRNRSNSDLKGENTMFGAELVYISPNYKGKKEVGDLVKLSLWTANTVKPENAAIEYAYHARVLLAIGDIAGARAWLEKATAKLDIYEPAEYRHNMKKYIDDAKKKVELAAKS